jgi:hypothetical protein
MSAANRAELAAATPAAQAVIPAALLYWGLLPASAHRQPGEAARYRFERLLPLPVERLHTASTTCADGALLIVGVESERLREHLGARSDIGPSTWSLVPDQLPGHHAATGITASELARLNLLTGAFEPAQRRRARRLAIGMLQAALALALALGVIGSERRAAALDQRAQALRALSVAALAKVLPAQPASQAHPELALTMELRALGNAARSPAASSVDVAAMLEGLWAVWPANLRLQAETVTATSERIVIRGTVPSLGEAERLATSCAAVAVNGARYRAEPLQAQNGEHGTTVLLTLVRQAGSTP